MSSVPPETPPPSATPPSPPPPSFGSPMQIPGTIPIPGNAEFPVYLLAAAIIAIIVGASDTVTWGDFVFSFTLITLAYLISRGIAKASRVYER